MLLKVIEGFRLMVTFPVTFIFITEQLFLDSLIKVAVIPHEIVLSGWGRGVSAGGCACVCVSVSYFYTPCNTAAGVVCFSPFSFLFVCFLSF